MITQEQVRKLFDYNPETGDITRKISVSSNTMIGDPAGYKGKRGYKYTSIKNKKYYNHRIAFLYYHGYLPKSIDHINGNPLDNSIKNLRECTQSQNGCNKKAIKSKSGVKNVTWNNNTKRWCVVIIKSCKKHCFGCYDDLADAEKVAIEKREELHGEFANNG